MTDPQQNTGERASFRAARLRAAVEPSPYIDPTRARNHRQVEVKTTSAAHKISGVMFGKPATVGGETPGRNHQNTRRLWRSHRPSAPVVERASIPLSPFMGFLPD